MNSKYWNGSTFAKLDSGNAVNADKVDNYEAAAFPQKIIFTQITLTAAGWQSASGYYYQNNTAIAAVLATDLVQTDVVLSTDTVAAGNQITAFALINKCVVTNGQLQFWCIGAAAAPSVDLTINVSVTR